VLRGDADELRRVGSHRQFLIGHDPGAYDAAVGLWVVGIHRAVVGWITGIRRSPMASARTARSISSTTPAWRAPVHVRTEHDHQLSPLLLAVEVDGRRTRLAGGAATLLSSHAGHPRPATSDTTKGSQARRADSLKASQLAAGRDPLLSAGHHRRGDHNSKPPSGSGPPYGALVAAIQIRFAAESVQVLTKALGSGARSDW
jgi:hypothetical protein